MIDTCEKSSVCFDNIINVRLKNYRKGPKIYLDELPENILISMADSLFDDDVSSVNQSLEFFSEYTSIHTPPIGVILTIQHFITINPSIFESDVQENCIKEIIINIGSFFNDSFPVEQIIEKYWSDNHDFNVIASVSHANVKLLASILDKNESYNLKTFLESDDLFEISGALLVIKSISHHSESKEFILDVLPIIVDLLLNDNDSLCAQVIELFQYFVSIHNWRILLFSSQSFINLLTLVDYWDSLALISLSYLVQSCIKHGFYFADDSLYIYIHKCLDTDPLKNCALETSFMLVSQPDFDVNDLFVHGIFHKLLSLPISISFKSRKLALRILSVSFMILDNYVQMNFLENGMIKFIVDIIDSIDEIQYIESLSSLLSLIRLAKETNQLELLDPLQNETFLVFISNVDTDEEITQRIIHLIAKELDIV